METSNGPAPAPPEFKLKVPPELQGTVVEQMAEMLVAEATRQQPGRGRRVLYDFGEDANVSVDTDRVANPRVVAAPAPGEEIRTDTQGSPLEKKMVGILDQNEIARLAFTSNPQTALSQTIWRRKPRGAPPWLLKRIARQDDLTAAIVLTRATQNKSFGQPRRDRFSTGFTLETRVGVEDRLSPTEMEQLHARIERLEKLLDTCGSNNGYLNSERMSLARFLHETMQSAVVVGQIAVERIPDREGQPHSFRPVDAGTIFPPAPIKSGGEEIRKQAVYYLARLQGVDEEVVEAAMEADDWDDQEKGYAWVQVIDETVKQVFTDDRLIVRNFYPVPDVEMDGFPWTPIDSAIAAVTTHINISTHNKVYFQSGRASKGMLVMKTKDADAETIRFIQQHMQASINGASNAWRMPVFAIGPEDELEWKPIDQQGSRDGEFQYLSDANARTLLAAFQISPDEVQGYGYLSRGTNSQALSESNNEYKLEAARDVGIRPLIREFECLFNDDILPWLDPGIEEFVQFRMMGLDTDSAEKEANRIAEDMPLHMTMNDVLRKVEKEPLPPELGGDVPLNPQYHQLVLDKFVPQGVILEKLLKIPGASAKQENAFVNNPNWMNWQKMLFEQAQAAKEQQMAAQEQARQVGQGQPATGAGGAGPGAEVQDQPGVSGQDVMPGQTERQKSQAQQQAQAEALHQSVGGALDAFGKAEDLYDLEKSEKHLPPPLLKVLKQHRRMIAEFQKGFAKDRDDAKAEILAGIDELVGEG